MAHISCHSYITGRDVKYSLIGVKLKHKVKQEDYGAYLKADNRSYWNTSPYKIGCVYVKKPYWNTISGNLYEEDKFMYGTSGGYHQSYSASGILESEYENHNTGVNPRIGSSVYNINEFNLGYNTRDLFETDTVKIVLEVVKCKIEDLEAFKDGKIVLDNDFEVIFKVYIKYILKSSNTVIGIYDLTLTPSYRMFPVTFSISAELWCIKDFVPKYKSTYGHSGTYNMNLSYSNGTDNNGMYVDGIKSQETGDFIGASFTMLCSECYNGIYGGSSSPDPTGNYKITKKDGIEITNSELRDLTNNAGILYYRHKINSDPNQFIELVNYDSYKLSTAERMEWCNSNLNTKEYKMMLDNAEYNDNIYNSRNFTTTPILMPCVNPTTFKGANRDEEGMFISLTNNILEGPAPDQDPDPEPLDPETVEPADNPETEYTPPAQEEFEDFPYRGSDTITGIEPGYNAFRPSYSNYIFPKYYRDSIEGDSDWESAIAFIQEACNPSAFEAWGAAFKLITGHPTPGEIISRVYYLPFEYNEIRGEDSAGFYFSAPVYGPVGPVTLGVKTHSEDPSNTGEPIESNVHYYQQIVNRFKTINLGQVTIDRVFNNFLDFSEVTYTLNLPYGAGQVELDPDLLFKNDISVGNVKLTGVIDFDTGELTIIIQLNGQRYYETTVNVAIDRLASVADNMAAPLAIAKATMAAATTAGRIAKGLI